MDDQWLIRKNRLKVIRTIFEVIVMVFAFSWVVKSLWDYKQAQVQPSAMPPQKESAMISSESITEGYDSMGHASGTHFIALAYNGVVFYVGHSVSQPNVVNTVGAGDSMVAGFIAKTDAGVDYETALRFASACGTATAASKGIAKRATIDRVVERLDKIIEEREAGK